MGSKDLAYQILKEVEAVFPENRLLHENNAPRDSTDSASYNEGGGGNKLPSASELAIGLVDKRAVLYFKDEYGTPHIKIKVGDHMEIIPGGCPQPGAHRRAARAHACAGP